MNMGNGDWNYDGAYVFDSHKRQSRAIGISTYII